MGIMWVRYGTSMGRPEKVARGFLGGRYGRIDCAFSGAVSESIVEERAFCLRFATLDAVFGVLTALETLVVFATSAGLLDSELLSRFVGG